MPELNTLLRSISLMEVEYPGKNPRDLFQKSLFSVSEQLDIRQSNGKLMDRSGFVETLRRLIDLGKTSREDAGCVGEESITEHIRDRLGEELLIAKAVLYFKILEEIAIKSDEDDIWKPAMSEIGNEIIEESMLQGSDNWRAILAAECIRRVYEHCDGEKSRYALNIVLAQKCRLATDIFAEALFRRYPGNERAVGLTLASFAQEDILLAALFARSNLTFNKSQAFLERLHEQAVKADPGNRERTLAFLRKRDGEYEGSPIVRHLLGGISRIFDINGVTPPYPGYKETTNRYGLPVARFDDMSMHRAAFLSLPRIGGARALALMAQGIGQLIIPNIVLTAHGYRAEPDMMSSLPEISRALVELSCGNGIRSGNSDLLSSLVLGYPDAVNPLEQRHGSLIAISPVLMKVVMEAEWAGAGEAPLSLCASQAILQGLMMDVGPGNSSTGNSRIIERNIAAMRSAHESVFSSIDESDIRKMKDFLGSLSRKGIDGKLERQLPANGAKNGSGSVRPGSIRPAKIS